MPSRQFTVSATYEFPTKPPLTVRGTFSAGGLKTAASKGIGLLKKAYPGRQPSSVAMVIFCEDKAPKGAIRG